MENFIPEAEAKEIRENKIDALIMKILSSTTRTALNAVIPLMNRLAMVKTERQMLENIFNEKRNMLPKEEKPKEAKTPLSSSFAIGRNSSGQLIKWTFIGSTGNLPIRTLSMEILPALSFNREYYKKECSKWEHKFEKETKRTNAKMNNFCG